MPSRFVVSAIALGTALTLLIPAVSFGQFGGIGRRLSNAVADEIGDEMERLLRDGVRCAFNDQRCIDRARAEGKTPVMTDGSGNVMTDAKGRPITDPAAAAAQAGAAGAVPGTGVWANYDFVPGDRVIFFDDYQRDRVGDFPRRFDLLGGNWEVVEARGQRFVRATSGGAIRLDLPETLPDRFTLEFPVSVAHGNASLVVTTAPDRKFSGSSISFRYASAGLQAVGKQGPEIMTTKRTEARGGVLVTLRVMADGEYMKVYLDDHRVVNAPNAVFPRTNTLYFTVAWAYEANPIMIGPMRIAAGGLELYDRLAAEGRVATHGILFAVDSDVIRPESTPTLKEIGDMLTQHADLRLTIEGHTDSDGDDAHNLDLSRRRAASVKAFLVSSHKIAGNRLLTEGYGESRPAADNGTPEGRQQNRRVELVRLGG
jgi:outer membrane protein OmpA-like peptidoglycan-associated protein